MLRLGAGSHLELNQWESVVAGRVLRANDWVTLRNRRSSAFSNERDDRRDRICKGIPRLLKANAMDKDDAGVRNATGAPLDRPRICGPLTHRFLRNIHGCAAA